jgi:hypothetical protein
MSEMKSYQPGTFSWADIGTTDIAAAKKFYGEIFGWKTEDMPTPMGPYSMAKLNGKDVAGIGGLDPKQGMPPHWNNYFWVANVDESAKLAASLGGKILMAPMDAEQAGRFAVIADPSGAAFCLWQAKKHMGAELVNEQGAICWAELETRNVDACGKFYSKLFNWEPSVQDMPGMKYTIFNAGKDQRAGMMAMNAQAPAAMPSHWTVYFGVDNCDKRAAQISQLGGKVVVPPTDIPEVGRFAMAMDPQGAFFAILQPTRR